MLSEHVTHATIAVSGTAYMDFDHCKVPTENLIGAEHEVQAAAGIVFSFVGI